MRLNAVARLYKASSQQIAVSSILVRPISERHSWRQEADVVCDHMNDTEDKPRSI